MQAAEPCASPIRPAACIVPVYCINMSETVTFTAVWSKSLIVYATKIHMCIFLWEIPNDHWVKRTRSKHDFWRKFSPRALVRGIPARVDFMPKNCWFCGCWPGISFKMADEISQCLATFERLMNISNALSEYWRTHKWLIKKHKNKLLNSWQPSMFNSSPPGQNGRHFADVFRCIFMNEKFCILIKISLKFVSMGPIDNNPALIKIMAWRWIGDKLLSEQMPTRFTDAYMRDLGEMS